jgi:hypothetical protein
MSIDTNETLLIFLTQQLDDVEQDIAMISNYISDNPPETTGELLKLRELQRKYREIASSLKNEIVKLGSWIMAKRKQIAAPEPSPVPRVGDQVKRPGSDSILEITQVYADGEVNPVLPGTNLEWFRVRTDTLTFVERKPQPKTSNPFTTSEPEIDTAEVMERIVTVQQESLITAASKHDEGKHDEAHQHSEKAHASSTAAHGKSTDAHAKSAATKK